MVTDFYAEHSPEDSRLWLWLLSVAWHVDRRQGTDLMQRLAYIRGGGTVLLPDRRHGYIMRPILTGQERYGWNGMEHYRKEAACLLPFTKGICNLLHLLAVQERGKRVEVA